MDNRQPARKELFWNTHEICQIDGFWYYLGATESITAFRSGFQPRNGDVLCREPREQVRKLASFLGKPFDDGDGEVEKVLWRSSLNRLKELEVNGFGELMTNIPNTAFFRKGTVGDWKNYLTPEMAQRIDELTRVKLQGTGLCLDDF